MSAHIHLCEVSRLERACVNVRPWGKSGHRRLIPRCLLLIPSGHSLGLAERKFAGARVGHAEACLSETIGKALYDFTSMKLCSVNLRSFCQNSKVHGPGTSPRLFRNEDGSHRLQATTGRLRGGRPMKRLLNLGDPEDSFNSHQPLGGCRHGATSANAAEPAGFEGVAA